MKLREMKAKYAHKKKQAERLQQWILKDFEASKMYDKFANAVVPFKEFEEAEDQLDALLEGII